MMQPSGRIKELEEGNTAPNFIASLEIAYRYDVIAILFVVCKFQKITKFRLQIATKHEKLFVKIE
jgi:hypothetical protein